MSSYILITSQTLSSTQTSVTFNSIPTTLNDKTLRDLVLVIVSQVGASAELNCRVNGDSGSNYSWGSAGANGSTTISQQASSLVNFMRFTERGVYAAGNWVQHQIQIFDYAQAKHKSVLVRNDASLSGVGMLATRWANTSTITSLEVYPNSNSFQVGSTFFLYGIEG